MARKKKEETLDNLEAIKRLLILMLINRGVNIQVVADILKVNKSTVSRLVPQKNFKKE
jgi:hypothetical protein